MKVLSPCDLTAYNSYRIAARCDVAYFPNTVEEVVGLMAGDLHATPYVLLGSGHNVILAKPHYRTPFLIFHGNLADVSVDGVRLTAGAGTFTQRLCETAAAHSLSGLEVFYDIPSSVGGAVAMNAGGHGEEICDVLAEATYLDVPTGHVIEASNEALQFRYRNSLFQRDPTKIVLSAAFQLRRGDPAAIRAKMEEIKALRWSKQPRQYPNAGSVFKRPPGRFVGPMMDELGLKGHAVAGFRVSPKHGGFIERTGPGSGADLLALIASVRGRVRDAYGLELDIEQRIIDVE